MRAHAHDVGKARAPVALDEHDAVPQELWPHPLVINPRLAKIEAFVAGTRCKRAPLPRLVCLARAELLRAVHDDVVVEFLQALGFEPRFNVGLELKGIMRSLPAAFRPDMNEEEHVGGTVAA